MWKTQASLGSNFLTVERTMGTVGNSVLVPGHLKNISGRTQADRALPPPRLSAVCFCSFLRWRTSWSLWRRVVLVSLKLSSGDRISPRPFHHHLYNDFFGLETSRVWFWPTTLVPSITGKSPGPAPSLFSETVYSVVWGEDAVSSHPIHFQPGVLHPVACPQEAWNPGP